MGKGKNAAGTAKGPPPARFCSRCDRSPVVRPHAPDGAVHALDQQGGRTAPARVMMMLKPSRTMASGAWESSLQWRAVRAPCVDTFQVKDSRCRSESMYGLTRMAARRYKEAIAIFVQFRLYGSRSIIVW